MSRPKIPAPAACWDASGTAAIAREIGAGPRTSAATAAARTSMVGWSAAAASVSALPATRARIAAPSSAPAAPTGKFARTRNPRRPAGAGLGEIPRPWPKSLKGRIIAFETHPAPGRRCAIMVPPSRCRRYDWTLCIRTYVPFATGCVKAPLCRRGVAVDAAVPDNKHHLTCRLTGGSRRGVANGAVCWVDRHQYR